MSMKQKEKQFSIQTLIIFTVNSITDTVFRNNTYIKAQIKGINNLLQHVEVE